MLKYDGLDVVCAYCGKPVQPIKVENFYYTYCPCNKGTRHRYEFLGLTAQSSFIQFCQDRRAGKILTQKRGRKK